MLNKSKQETLEEATRDLRVSARFSCGVLLAIAGYYGVLEALKGAGTVRYSVNCY